MIEHAIVVMNGKGGVGKTSLTANLGGLAAHSGWRVLLIDIDQQGNLARDLGVLDASDAGMNLRAAIAGTGPLTAIPARANLDLVPAENISNRSRATSTPPSVKVDASPRSRCSNEQSYRLPVGTT
jgi:cellulose biosynthesis protein BcsQ